MHKEIPAGLKAYKRTPSFNEKTIPKGLLKDHQTMENVWAKLIIEKGELYLNFKETKERVKLDTQRAGIIEAQELHHVETIAEVSFYVEFYK